MTPSNIKMLETRIGRIKEAISEINNNVVQEEIKCLYGKDLHGIMQHNYLQHINTLFVITSYSIHYTKLYDSSSLSRY